MIEDDEVTFEITNYCPHDCRFCSTDSIDNYNDADFMDISIIKERLQKHKYEHIIISGGEPLSHPNFWNILQLCKQNCNDVVVYTNAINHIIYNPHVIDGIYLEANITITPETDKIHILRRVKQGRESKRPEIHLSRNHTEECACNHRIIKSDGNTYFTPCNKYNIYKNE